MKGEYEYPKPRSKFLKVECSKCGKEQVIFGSAAEEIRCRECREVLAESTGGKANVKTKIKEILG